METKMKMMTRAEKEGVRERETEREEREGKKRRDGEAKHRHGPQTLMLLREPLSRSQTVACAEVQASAFKMRFLRCQSWRTDGLEAPRLEVFV